MCDSFKWVMCFIQKCDALYSNVWIIQMCDKIYSCMWHDSSICVTWLIHVSDVTYFYAWHDAKLCVTRRIQMCNDHHSKVRHVHSKVRHDSSKCMTWLIHQHDTAPQHNTAHPCVQPTHSYMWHDSLHMTRLIHISHTLTYAKKKKLSNNSALPWHWVVMGEQSCCLLSCHGRAELLLSCHGRAEVFPHETKQ